MDEMIVHRLQRIAADTLLKIPGSSALFWQFRKVAHHVPALRPIVKRAAVHVGRPAEVLLRGCKTSLRIAVTYRCGIDCTYCYARGLQEQFPSDMSISDFHEVARWTRTRKMTILRFVGGEPTEHPRFPEILTISRRSKLLVQVVTNNVWGDAVGAALDPSYIHFMCVNFSVWNTLDQGRRERFLANLGHCRRLAIPVELNYILDPEDDTMEQMLDVAARYRVALVRASLRIPGSAREVSGNDLLEALRPHADLVMRFSKSCLARRLVGRMYRPLPLCMFTQGEREYLLNIDRYYFYPRCSIGYACDYGNLLTANPDLSTFPCASVYIQGPSLLDLTSAEQASDFFRGPLHTLMRAPLTEACLDCPTHHGYVESLNTGHPEESAEDFFRFDRCQGGCLSFRDASVPLCHE